MSVSKDKPFPRFNLPPVLSAPNILGLILVSQIIACQNSPMNNLDRISGILQREYGCINLSYASGNINSRFSCPQDKLQDVRNLVDQNPDLQFISEPILDSSTGQVSFMIGPKLTDKKSTKTAPTTIMPNVGSQDTANNPNMVQMTL
jgi:hypothetical protein